MCGRLACTLCPDDLSTKCKYYNKNKELENPKWIDSFYEYKPVFNGPPSTIVPVLTSKLNFPEITENYPDYCLAAMKWGMMPTYKTDTVGNFHTHNARIENIMKSPLYKPCLQTGKRCAILADGYYEWQTTQGENHKQPYYMYQMPNESDLKNKYVIKLAGLFNIIRDDMGIKYTCTILTTQSDKSLAWMHYRMPVILNTEEDINNWLNYKDIKYEEALSKLPKYDMCDKKYQLKYYAVNKTYVNTTSCNEEKCMQRMTVKRKSSTLDGWLKKSSK